jgi:pyridoxine 5-phosphate synthase
MKVAGGRLRLGVNIDHVASIREARHTAYPDILRAARVCENAGADSITVHLREDRRHIQDRDVAALRRTLRTPLNLEMAVSPQIVRIALRIRPDEVCIVPERRRELTTEGGLDVAGRLPLIRRTVARLARAGIRVSLFIEADPRQVRAAAAAGAPCVELHTGTFCNATGPAARRELRRLCGASRLAHSLGMQVNAGHGISLQNIAAIMAMPHLDTLNIGHSIVADSIFVGLRHGVVTMASAMRRYRGGKHA